MQSAGVLLILGSIGAFAEGGPDLSMVGFALIVIGLVFLYLGGRADRAARPERASEPSWPSPRLVGDPGAMHVVVAVWTGLYARQCWGDLYLGDETLTFVCYADRMAIGSAAATILRCGRVRAQFKGAPLEEAVKYNKYSRRFALSDVTAFDYSLWTGRGFRAGGSRYPFLPGVLGRPQRDQIRAWCQKHGIPCKGF